MTRDPAATFYGGYAGCFRDPDGHVWEVAFNPGFALDDSGNLGFLCSATPQRESPDDDRPGAFVIVVEVFRMSERERGEIKQGVALFTPRTSRGFW